MPIILYSVEVLAGVPHAGPRGFKVFGRAWGGAWSFGQSCPSRGTWIEMFCGGLAAAAAFVVPLAGHVD